LNNSQNLIVVIYKIEPKYEINRTIASLTGLKSNTSVLFVLSEINEELSCIIRKVPFDYKILIERQSGIYTAMNVGIDEFNANSFQTLMFINGGDELIVSCYNDVCAHLEPNEVTSFRTYQVYEDLVFERPSLSKSRNFKNAPHQGIVVKSNICVPRFVFAAGMIHADVDWQVRLSLAFNWTFRDEIISKLHLGGVSNRPTINTVKIRVRTQGLKRGLKEFFKLLIFKILGIRRYYRFISKGW